MYLKKLELSGFKSFAKTTVLDFPSGITAIVGPNGSGKSNIVDAIRWVLTEQSYKNLRSKKSDDIIFHGSSGRNALSRAKVSLYLENSGKSSPLDTEEVVVSRLVKRGGENNYFLNDRKVRLLDLEAYLSKSGIGESSFRVLSQGMSDRLITLDPKEFREFIEEAAAVKEYQDKKRRSLLKLRSCQQNIEKVSALLAELRPRVKHLKRESSRFSERHEIEESLKETAKKLFGFRYHTLVSRETRLAKNKKELEEKLKSASEELDKLKKELFSFERKSLKNEELQDIILEIQKLENKEYDLNKKIISLQGRVELAQERKRQIIPLSRESLEKNLKDIINFAETSSSKSVISDIVSKLKSLLDDIVGKKEDSSQKEEILRTQKEIEKAIKERDAIRERSNDLTNRRDKVNENFLESNEDLIKKEKAYREKEEETHKLRLEFNGIELEEEKLKIRKEQLNHDIRSVNIIKLADITTVDPGKINEEKTEEEMWSLKRKMERIGSIDPSVEEEYKDVSTRYEFLEKESLDLNNALKSLNKIIRDLDLVIDKRFEETLTKMSESFASYARLMFGGGKASLSKIASLPADSENLENLEEEGEEEKEGIKINVELPGKKIKGLNNLSGGERTLVSIALLFALVSVRRPPFLVLDEIDAALDEVNSQRFVRLIKNLKEETQFIMITHNRETMRGVDALYGVSMKDGISSLLSIKLEPAEETVKSK